MNKFKLLVAPLLVLPFVVGCNNGGGQDPVVYHTLKFVSETCYMKDDIGGQVSEKQFEAGETANFRLDPHEGYLLPLENQVDFKDTKTGEDFTGTYSYNPANGDISVKMTADVTIYAGNSEDTNYVTEQEFKDAISFKDVQYLQVAESVTISPVMTYSKNIEMSPSVSHITIDITEEDVYVRKNATDPVTYDECYKDPTSGKFVFQHNVGESNFIKPQTYLVGNFEKSLLDTIKELLGDDYFSSFTYFKEEGVYKAVFTKGTVVLEFENKKIVGYDFDAESEMYKETTGVLTYEEKTPEYPIEPGL